MDGLQAQALTAANRKELYEKLRAVWDHGANVIVDWRTEPDQITVFYVPILILPRVARQFGGLLSRGHLAVDDARQGELIEAGCLSAAIPLSFVLSDNEITERQIEAIIRHYRVTRSNCRGVGLFDIVGFSLSSPFVKIAQINLLSYHINRAAECVAAVGLPIDLTTSTTGDGFYIWNRNEGLEADLALFYVTCLTLLFNRAAMLDLPLEPIPELRCCFDFGEHYEFYQASGTKPDSRGYIVGDVTIKLARLIAAALPKQFLVGDSVRRTGPADLASQRPVALPQINMPLFFQFAKSNARLLSGQEIGSSPIESVIPFLTGDKISNTDFTIKKYAVSDKHNLHHRCFNARVTAHDGLQRKIDIGLPDAGLTDFTARHVAGEDIQIRAM